MVGATIGGWQYTSIQPVGAPPPRPGSAPGRTAAGDPAARADAALRSGSSAHAGGAPGDPQGPRRRRPAALARGRQAVSGRPGRRAAGHRPGRAAATPASPTTSGPPPSWPATACGCISPSTPRTCCGSPSWFCSAETGSGWSEIRTMELLVGTSEATSEPARALRVLAARPDSDPGFDEALADYQRVHGCRALEAEVAEPTLAESPELLSAMLDRLRDGCYDPDAESAELAARRRASGDRRPPIAARPGPQPLRPAAGPRGSGLPAAGRERVPHHRRADRAGPVRGAGGRPAAHPRRRTGQRRSGLLLHRRGTRRRRSPIGERHVAPNLRRSWSGRGGDVASTGGRWSIPARRLTESGRRARRPSGSCRRSVRLPTEAMMWIGEAIVASDGSLRTGATRRRRAVHRHRRLGRPVHRARPSRALRVRSRRGSAPATSWSARAPGRRGR